MILILQIFDKGLYRNYKIFQHTTSEWDETLHEIKIGRFKFKVCFIENNSFYAMRFQQNRRKNNYS